MWFHFIYIEIIQSPLKFILRKHLIVSDKLDEMFQNGVCIIQTKEFMPLVSESCHFFEEFVELVIVSVFEKIKQPIVEMYHSIYICWYSWEQVRNKVRPGDIERTLIYFRYKVFIVDDKCFSSIHVHNPFDLIRLSDVEVRTSILWITTNQLLRIKIKQEYHLVSKLHHIFDQLLIQRVNSLE